MTTFALETDEALLLLELERSETITQVAKVLKRDPSVISRSLKNLSKKLPVIQKSQGRWVVTELGQKFNYWTSQAIIGQQNILNQRIQIKIGSTREFAARYLINGVDSIFPKQEFDIHIITFDSNSESLLLNGQVDLLFDCGKPYDPQIAFKRPALEKMSFVISKEFKKKYKITSTQNLSTLPHIHYSRNNLARLYSMTKDQLNLAMTVNDIALVRQAVSNSIGWGLLPTYTIKEEISKKLLFEVPQSKAWLQKPYQFGLWWNREKTYLSDHINALLTWLEDQELN